LAAGTLVYECPRGKTFFFVVREDDPVLVDLLDGVGWERWVTEEYSPYQYEGKSIKVLKPRFAGLNLSGPQ
jgi:hypothetical protein